MDVGADGRALTCEANGIAWFVLTDPEGNEFCVGSRTLINAVGCVKAFDPGAEAVLDSDDAI